MPATPLFRPKPLTSVLIKPAGPDCNMRCRYCFYLEKDDLFTGTKTHRMSFEILEETTKQMLQQPFTSVNFGWQGGEPTLMGLPFFQKAVVFQKKYARGNGIGNGLQTNGLLIDRAWCDFLRKEQFLVGLSLDGPQHVHDHYRYLKGKQKSWSKIMNSCKRMLDTGVNVNALCVVNDYSVRYPQELYYFFKSAGLSYMQFIPCVETDRTNADRAAPYSVAAGDYGDFLCTLFDLWLADFQNDRPTTSIRYFESLFFTYVNQQPPECTLLNECGSYLVIEHNGDVFACDFFVEPEWHLGNVMRDRLTDLLNGQKQNHFGSLKASLPDVCLVCPWLQRCRGGCTKDRLRDPRDNGLNHFCRAYQQFFAHADAEFKRLAAWWRRDQKRQEIASAVKQGKLRVQRNDPCPCGSGKKFKKCCGRV
jgi:uncharacterized protein